MIEIISADRCTACNVCVDICPMDVFDGRPGRVPTLARHSDCQTCFQCEAYCPAEAIVVAPQRTPAGADSPWHDEEALLAAGAFGAYRGVVGWRPGAARARDTTDYHGRIAAAGLFGRPSVPTTTTREEEEPQP